MYIYNYIYIGIFIIPTDDLTFFRGVAQPPSSDLGPSDSADSNGSPGSPSAGHGTHGARYRKSLQQKMAAKENGAGSSGLMKNLGNPIFISTLYVFAY